MLTVFTKTGGTVFLSSHLLSILEDIADSVSIIKEGTLVKRNVPVELIRSTLTSMEDFLLSVVEEGD